MTAEGIKDVPRKASKKLAWAALAMALAWLPALFAASSVGDGLRPYFAWPALALFVGALVISIVAVRKAKREPSRYAGLGPPGEFSLSRYWRSSSSPAS